MSGPNLSASPPPTKRPHLVSRVVAHQFTNGNHVLTRLSIDSRRVSAVGVKGFGLAPNIYPADPDSFEKRWKKFEDHLPEALAAVDDRTLFGNPALVDLLKGCLAVHLARGRTVTRVHQRVVREDRGVLEDTLAARPWVDESFRRAHSGLWPAGPQTRRMHVSRLIDDALATLNASSFTPDRMIALHDQVLPLVSRAELEVGIAQESEFLISDTPAQSLRVGHPGVGPVGGVPWDRATTIVMPIGRRHLIGLGRKAGFHDLDRAAVDYLNRIQIVGAEQTLAWHPDANLLSFAISTLDEIGRRQTSR